MCALREFPVLWGLVGIACLDTYFGVLVSGLVILGFDFLGFWFLGFGFSRVFVLGFDFGV